MINLNARNATLADISDLLTKRRAAAHDIVVPASTLRSRDGILHVRDADQRLTLDGVTTVNGLYRPTDVANEGISDKLGIPVSYLKAMHRDAVDLYDANVNGWLHGKTLRKAGEDARVLREADGRSFLLRTFRDQDGGEGIARAFLSDRYAIMDDLDALLAVLSAVRETGTQVEVETCDLTDRRMYVRVAAPAVAAMAPELLKNYRSPFTGQTGAENPMMFAGFEIRNSEVGQGQFSIVPMVVVQICKNGVTFTKEAYSKVHLGAKMETGVIQVSAETRQKNLELITSQTKDAVRTFLNPEYLRGKIAELEARAGIPVTSPEKQVKAVCKKSAFTEAEAEGILAHFIQGGQLTAGGVMQAVTSYSQTVENADRARVLDDAAADVLKMFTPA